MRACALLIASLLGACIEAQLTTCPDGLACPTGTVCDVAHHSCTTQEQLDACAGAPDLALCTTSAVSNGACHEGVCFPIECGNQRIDPGEVCDDGNHAPLDGCTPDCLSNETCGNGILDLLEECDDANLMSHDGCDSRCRTESLQWSHITTVTSFAFGGFASAYDTARGRWVVFGGSPPNSPFQGTANTLEWDGNGWIDRAPFIRPAPRTGPRMVYDAARRQMVMFGGFYASQAEGDRLFGDTWGWDGERWTELTQSFGPAPRWGHAMAYDAARRRVVMFGGNAAKADTWEWDGKTWIERMPAVSPPPLRYATMAYDPHRGVTVMYGGYTYDSAPVTDTWMWDGTIWTKVMDGSPGNAAFAMSYSPVLDGIVLTGGGNAWLWNGQQWTLLGSSTALDRAGHGSYFDPVTQRIVVGGGFGGYTSVMAAGDGSMWTDIPIASAPDPRFTPLLTYDARRGQVVMFGGASTTVNSFVNDVWTLDTTWHAASNDGMPAAWQQSMVYDSRRDRVLVWNNSQLWERDDVGWRMVWSTADGNGPASRQWGVMTYDEARGVAVLFGGYTTVDSDETWLWDGTRWTEATPPTRPPGRRLASMTYDAYRERVVLFGGASGSSVNSSPARNDTWEWDGTTWTEVTPVSSPSPSRRYGAAMTYDPRRRNVVLYGGWSQFLNDLWEWNGVKWTRLDTGAPVPAIDDFGPSITYDALQSSVVMARADGFWRLRWDSPTHDDVCGLATDLDGDGRAGCDDDDCAGACAPMCPPRTSCISSPRCGDLTCDLLETCQLCPADCGACTASCGNHICEPDESVASCPGDCTP